MHEGRDASARQSGKLPQFFDLETIRETQTQKTVCVEIISQSNSHLIINSWHAIKCDLDKIHLV